MKYTHFLLYLKNIAPLIRHISMGGFRDHPYELKNVVKNIYEYFFT